VDFKSRDEQNYDMSVICPDTGHPRRTMLVLASQGLFPPSMVHAIEREFPWITVEQRTEVAAADARYRFPLALILLDPDLLASLEALAATRGRDQPLPVVGLIEQESRDREKVLTLVERSRVARSVLPMNMRLDVWLSVIRLMLSGGEYYPPMIKREPEVPRHPAASLEPATVQAPAKPTALQLAGLTPREIEVLGMVALGMQNKSIASAFSLSEHTVKIHLHNIIAKLGVHNRTQAAAMYREAATNQER
jgi:DNA-binding NarL/FixJ family response regulator